MYRFDIINLLIKKHNFKKYLEIGVCNPDECFNLIECEDKDSVDPGVEFTDNPVKYPFTSDDFFDRLNKGETDKPSGYKWDIIFIDGLHISHQVEKDILNSLDHLSEEGIIVLHDCNPPEMWFAREDLILDGIPRAWNGTVWKSVYKLRATRPDLFVCTVDTDWGVGIVKRGGQICCDFDNSFFEYRVFESNRKDHLNLISVEEFKNFLDLNLI
jgi:hypothetical protein